LKRGIEILDYFFLTRPILFYPIWTFFLAGWFGGTHFSNSSNSFLNIPLAVIFQLTILMGSIFIINQIQDVETDRLNGKLFLVANGIVSKRSAYLEAAIFASIAIVWGFLMSTIIGILFILLFILSGLLYNYSPFMWKNKPIMGLITNGTGGMLIYLIGWSAGGGKGLPLLVLPYTFAGVSVYLNTTVPDIKGDKKAGKITFPVRFGVKSTALWALIFEAAVVVTSFFMREWILFIPALIAFPFFIMSVFDTSVSKIMLCTKLSIAALALSICVVAPYYLVLLVFIFFFSRWYYKKRFNFEYPSLRVS